MSVSSFSFPLGITRTLSRTQRQLSIVSLPEPWGRPHWRLEQVRGLSNNGTYSPLGHACGLKRPWPSPNHVNASDRTVPMASDCQPQERVWGWVFVLASLKPSLWPPNSPQQLHCPFPVEIVHRGRLTTEYVSHSTWSPATTGQVAVGCSKAAEVILGGTEVGNSHHKLPE